MDNKQSRTAAASELFNKKSLETKAEQSTLSWGGAEDKDVDHLSDEQHDSAQELLNRVVIISRERIANDPESATDVEVTAARLLDEKLERGLQMTPNEQSQLYMTLKNVESRVGEQDGAFAEEMKLTDEKGELTEAGEKYMADIAALKEEVFYNLTGINPEESFQYLEGDTYMEKVGDFMKVNAYARFDQLKDIGIKGTMKEMMKDTAWAVVGKMRAERKDSIEGTSVHADRLEAHRTKLFGERAGEFKPEEKANELAAASLDTYKTDMVRYVRLTMQRHMGSPGWLPNTTANKAEMKSIADGMEAATSIAEVEAEMDRARRAHERDGANTGLDKINERHENKSPEKAAELLILEEMVAGDNDRMAREALQSELGASEMELADEITKYEDEITKLSKSKTKNKERIAELEWRKGLAEEAMRMMDDRNIDVIRDMDHGTMTVSELSGRLPDALQDEYDMYYIDHLRGDDLDAAIAEEGDPKITNLSQLRGGSTKQKRDILERAIKKEKSIFKIAMLHFQFMGEKLS